MAIEQYIVLQGDVADSGDLSDVTLTGPAVNEVLVRNGSSQWVNQLLATASLDDNLISNAKLRDSAAFSVIGKFDTGSGDPADIVAGTNSVLGRVAGDLVFAQIATAQVADDAIDFDKLLHASGESILMGRLQGSGAGAFGEITLGANLTLTGSVLAATGGGATSLNDLSDVTLTSPATDSILIKTAGDYIDGLIVTNSVTDAAITDAKLRNSGGLSVIGRSVLSGGVPADITGAADQVLRVNGAGTVLDFGTIAGAGIANSAISFAKIQDISTDTLMGRDAAGTGVVTEIGVQGGILFTNTDFIEIAAFTGDVTKTQGGTVLTIATAAVTNTKFRDSAGFTVVGKQNTGTGDVADIGPAADFEVLRRNGTDIGWALIATTNIADNAVDFTKMLNLSADVLIGRGNGGGGGDPESITLGTNLSMSGTVLNATGGGAAALNDLTDVTLTSPATDSILIKTAGDYIDGLIVTNSVTNNAISYSKWQQLAGFSIAAKADTGTGDASDLTAGTNSVLGRVAGDLAFAAIVNAQITTGTIATDKLADVSSDILLGRGTAASGPVEEITIGASLNLDALNLERAAISGDVVVPLDSNTATIQPDSVSFDKMLDATAASRLIGRGSAGGAGTFEEITIDDSMAMNGTALERAALTGDVTAAQGGNATTIAAGVVTLTKIADAAANDRLLGSNNTGSGNPYIELILGTNLSITGSTLNAAGAAGALNDLSDVTLTSPATDSILIKTAGDYIDGLIVTNSVTDAAITLSKISDAAANERLLGSGAAGLGNPYTELTIGSSLSFAGTELAVTDPSSSGLDDYVMVETGATGAVIADHTDRTIAGNARGDNAVDLQTNRGAGVEVAAGADSVIGGGLLNTIAVAADRSTIAGGDNNTCNSILGFVGGGQGNNITGNVSVICGGDNLTINGPSYASFMGGGNANLIQSTNSFNVVVGGFDNDIDTNNPSHATIGGGEANSGERDHTTIPGGSNATARRFGEMAYGGASAADAQKVANVATVLTSDATQTIMGYTSTNATWASTTLDAATIPFPSSDTFMLAFEGYVIGMRANIAGDAAACFKIEGAVKKNDAGTVSFVGNPKVSVVGRDDSNLDCDVVLAGSNAGVNIRVTGIAAQDWTWACEWEGCEMLVPAL